MSVPALNDSSSVLQLYLLGGFRAVAGGKPVGEAEWRLRKAKQLVKLLALAPGHSLHREQLIDVLWPELEPESGTNNLHKALHVARRTLDPTGSSGILLHVQQDLVVLRGESGVWMDVEAFEEAAARARQSRQLPAYQEAVGLYSGDLLPEDRYEDWATARRDELRDLYLSLLLEQAQLQETAGDLSGAIESLRQVVAREPTHEPAHVALVRLHALAGHRHQALRQFHRLREALQRELDTEPSPEAERAYQAVLSGEPSPAPVSAPGPSAPTAQATTSNWPELPPLAGRNEELDRLEEALEGLLAGRGATVLISGEAGIGKSRLAQEVARRAAREGARVLWGAAYEQESQLPYGPFIEALQTLPQDAQPERLSGLLQPSEGPGGGRPAPGPPKRWQDAALTADRQRLFLAVADFVSELSARSPVVLVLDDLQAADEASLELLHFLARTQRDAPLLVLGTFRPEDLEQAPRLASFLAAAQRERLALRMDLHRLRPQESEAMVAALLGPAPIDRGVFQAVYEFAEGNPFYTEELVRALQEGGALAQVDGRWRLQGAATVPRVLAEVIAHRFLRLREPTRQTLNLMAAIGRETAYPLLRTAAGIPEGELLDALDDALAHRVVEESAEGYRFAHPLQRAVLYQQLSRARRSSLHGQVARSMEALYQGRLEEHAPELGHHLAHSDAPLLAVPHLRTAARRAAAVFANEQAVRTYEQAIAILDGAGAAAGPAETAALLEEMADLLQRMGEPRQSEPLYRRAMHLLSEQGDDAAVGRLRAKAALSAITEGDVDQAGQLLRATLESMNDKWPQLVVARTYYALAQLRWHSAQHREALEAAELALRAAQSTDDLQSTARAYEVMALACHSLGDWQKGIEYELQRTALGVGGFDTDEAFDAHL